MQYTHILYKHIKLKIHIPAIVVIQARLYLVYDPITRTHNRKISMILPLLSNKTVFSASNIRGTSYKEKEA